MNSKISEFSLEANSLLSYPLNEKAVLWLSEINKYILVNPPADKIIELIVNKTSEASIIDYCVDELKFTEDEAKEIVHLAKFNLAEIKKTSAESGKQVKTNYSIPHLKCKRYYKINKLVFFIEYESPEIEYLIHPKFAHLEVPPTSNFHNHFQLFKIDTKLVLKVNDATIGSWGKDMEHFMTGKVSMEILQKIHKNEEKDWMAVFHAAGISNGMESIMFLGDSGNGKSTLSAILLANGFDVLADDFLPAESKTSQLCSFPAAISVKKHAIDLLTPKFPELENAREYAYPLFNKTVRYLSNPKSTSGAPKKVPCKALVFIKYEAQSEIEFKPLQKHIAFQKLVPDSWISPLENNAKQFMKWFGELPCYQLTYSNNEAMVKTVNKIFADEL